MLNLNVRQNYRGVRNSFQGVGIDEIQSFKSWCKDESRLRSCPGDDGGLHIPASIIPQRLENNRPEITLFEVNIKVNKEYEDLAQVAVMPKIALFAKLGYGKPNQFNMFENEWTSN